MRIVLWLYFVVTLGAGTEGEERSHVTVLTEAVFDSFVNSKTNSLVQFYAPWCGHCKKLAPEYERAAKILAGEADLAKLDCTLHRQLCERHHVMGFPTITLFRRDGTSESYEGERETDAIVRYMRKQSKPAFLVLESEVEIEDFKKKRGFIALARLQTLEGQDFQTFAEVAHKNRNICEFGVVTNPELFHLLGTHISLPDLTVFKLFDEPQVHFDSEWTIENLHRFLELESFPLVGGIGPGNYTRYIERGLPLLWLFLDPRSETSQEITAAAETVAKEFRGKISAVTLDGVRWTQHASSLGVKGVPGAVVQVVGKKPENYVLFDTPSEASLRTHVEGVLEGKLLSTLKSQPLPTHKAGNVTILVGQNFEEVTQDPTKIVFVLFFAPWCGHCKRVLPQWDALADMYADNPDVVIAKLAVTGNEVRIVLQGVPTIMLFPKGGGGARIYDGDREAASMHKFLTDLPTQASSTAREEL